MYDFGAFHTEFTERFAVGVFGARQHKEHGEETLTAQCFSVTLVSIFFTAREDSWIGA
jgi:hypothetical protein